VRSPCRPGRSSRHLLDHLHFTNPSLPTLAIHPLRICPQSEKIEAAVIRHYTSRAGDPHRHLHLQVNARVWERVEYIRCAAK
jgi:hypothetical protein